MIPLTELSFTTPPGRKKKVFFFNRATTTFHSGAFSPTMELSLSENLFEDAMKLFKIATKIRDRVYQFSSFVAIRGIFHLNTRG